MLLQSHTSTIDKNSSRVIDSASLDQEQIRDIFLECAHGTLVYGCVHRSYDPSGKFVFSPSCRSSDEVRVRGAMMCTDVCFLNVLRVLTGEPEVRFQRPVLENHRHHGGR